MKIIDLLNKIANGEEVPKKIKYKNKEFEFIGGSYEDEEGNDLCSIYYSCSSFLNYEVEILEEEKKTPTLNDIRESYGLPRIEEKKIPEKLPIGLKQTKDGIFNTIVKDDIQYELNEKEVIICKKIHEIIDYLKSKGE